MLIDDLREKLKELEPELETIKTFWKQSGNEEEFTRLHTISMQEHFWQNPDQATILKKLQRIRTQRDQYQSVLANQSELSELIELLQMMNKNFLN